MTASEKLKSDFTELRGCLILLRRDYNNYTALFHGENDALLNGIAPTFFSDIADILQRDWLLQAAKLMDPPISNVRGEERENLTIELIIRQLKDEELSSAEIEESAESLLSYGGKLKEARNRIIAHRDRQAHIDGMPLGSTTDEDLAGFMNDIQEFSDLVGKRIGIGPLDFSCSACKGDVIDFLQALRQLTVARQQR